MTLKTLALSAFAALALAATPVLARAPAAPEITPDIPAHFEKPTAQNDWVKRVVMIPMRDGVKLYTVIVMKKGTHNGPILLSRTPYDAKGSTERSASQK